MNKKYFLLAFLIIYSSLIFSQSQCLQGLQLKIVKKIGIASPEPVKSLGYPKAVALGKTYTITADNGLSYACAYAGETSLNSVRAGWVDNEADNSTTFWQLSYFDSPFNPQPPIVKTFAFSLEINIPKDSIAKKHKFLKLQVSLSVTAPASNPNCPDWFRTYIIRIPVADHIYGQAMIMDVTPTPQTKDYNMYSVKTPTQYVDACYNNDQGCKVADSSGCYQIYIPQALNTKNLNLYSHKSDTVSSVSLTDIPDSCYLETRLYAGITAKNRVMIKKLENKKMSVNKVFSGSLLGGASDLLLQLFNEVFNTKYTGQIDIPVNLIYNFNKDKLEALLTNYNQYVKPYQQKYKGEGNDSLRAEMLVRLLYAMQGDDQLYNDAQDMTIETGNMVWELFKLLPVWSTIQNKLSIVKSVNPKDATQMAALAHALPVIAACIEKMVVQINDYITNQSFKVSPDKKQYNDVSKQMSTMLTRVSYSCNWLFQQSMKNQSISNPQVLLQIANLFTEDGLRGIVDLTGMSLFLPLYVKDASSNLNKGIEQWGLNKEYYNQPSAGFQVPFMQMPPTLNGMKLTNKDAYWKAICPSNGNSVYGATHNFVLNTIQTSKQDRAISSGIDGVKDCVTGLGGKDVKSILDKVLTPINVIKAWTLGPIFLLDVVSLFDVFYAEEAIPTETFFPFLTIDPVPGFWTQTPWWDMYYYNGTPNSPLLKSAKPPVALSAHTPLRLPTVYSDIKSQIADIDARILNKLDTAEINAALWNNTHSKKDSSNMNLNAIALFDLADSLLQINNLVNSHVCSTNDSIVKINNSFQNNYMGIIGNNYNTLMKIFTFGSYLLDLKYRNGSLDTLGSLADSVRAHLSSYQADMNSVVDIVSPIPPKPFIIIKNVKITPDSLGTNIPFRLKATVFNFGTVAVNNIKVKITTDSLTHILTITDSLVISSLDANSGSEIEWDLKAVDPVQSYGYYNILADNTDVSYSYNGSFNINIIPLTQFAISGKFIYDNTPVVKPLKNVKLILKTVEGVKIDSTLSDNLGSYAFSNATIGRYFMEPSITKTPGSINPLDALYVNRNFIGTYVFSDPLKQLAADVNVDKKTNPTDALLINKRYIGIIPTFKAGDWLFAHDTIKVVNDNVIYNLKGICVGDVDGSFTPTK